MPKETINTEPIDGRTVETGTNLIAVSWGKGMCHVQIGIHEPDHIAGNRETGHYATLTPRQIDDLIATLRRAQRQAYQ